MKRTLGVTVLIAAVVLFVVVTRGQAQRPARTLAFFGYLVGTPRVAGVAIHLDAPDRTGRRALRAYVCDGLGVPEGISSWFNGVLPSEIPAGSPPLVFRSRTGLEELRITSITERGIYGAFTEASGANAQFSAYNAFDGAGIYQVSLDTNLRYTGMSLDGSRLVAQAEQTGITTGTIKPVGGGPIEFTVRSLALASPADLAEHGLPPDFPNYAADNQVPGEYTAVIAPGGSHWFGRGIIVFSDIIGLDKKEFSKSVTLR